MNNVLKHFKLITRHKLEVFKLMKKLGPGFYVQGLTHDLSKYSPTEFWTSVKYYSGRYSPTRNERNDKGYSLVWLHHKGRNKHHFEYWTDYIGSERDGLKPCIMPPRYFCEMICDRIAAAKTYNKEKYKDMDPYDYFDKNSTNDPGINPVIKKSLGKVLHFMGVKGENEAFDELRKVFILYGNKGTLMYTMINDRDLYFKED